MLTTAGSTILATLENSEESWVGEGMAIAVGPGATLGLSAFTERLTTVPITTPMASVAKIREKNRSFRLLMVSIILSINEIMVCVFDLRFSQPASMQQRFQRFLFSPNAGKLFLFAIVSAGLPWRAIPPRRVQMLFWQIRSKGKCRNCR
jgi:hypothetical protein